MMIIITIITVSADTAITRGDFVFFGPTVVTCCTNYCDIWQDVGG